MRLRYKGFGSRAGFAGPWVCLDCFVCGDMEKVAVQSEKVNIARFPRENNIQWLRIFFAMQVAVVHGIDKFWHIDSNFLRYVPGVPAFFFVSGFLIYSSWQNAPGFVYFQNRFLRLFPALVFVTGGGLLIVLYVRGVHDLSVHLPTYMVWFVFQTTLGQWYNPEIFRNVGVGVINGSLWTITTEIIFYIFVPIISIFDRMSKYSVVLFILMSFSLYFFGPLYLNRAVYRDKTVFDILSLTPLVWGWMFGFGILAVKYFGKYRDYIKYFPYVLALMAILIALGKFDDPILGCAGNRLGIIYFICYVMMIMYISFGVPFKRLDVDLSYGIYIWHMPILNLAVVLGIQSAMVFFFAVICMGVISWFCIERPCLRLKKRTIHKV